LSATVEAPSSPADPRSEVERAREGARRGARGGGARRVALYLVLPVALVLLCRLFVLEPLRIPSDSMSPTLRSGDRVLVNKLAYRFGEPEVNDLAVLVGPDGDLLAKRIVAFPGQRVELRDGILFVDRRPRHESYMDQSRVDGVYFGPYHVPPRSVFVLGDNRGDSEDSRDFGAIPRDDLIGEIVLRVPPLGDLVGAGGS
jgi:signal peptidase I